MFVHGGGVICVAYPCELEFLQVVWILFVQFDV